MAILGVTDHRFLDLPDGGLADLDPDVGIGLIGALLDEVRPDSTLTFGPDGGTFHPDHQTISAWVGAAWDRAGRPGRLLHATMTAEHLETWGERYEQWRVFMTDERPVGVAREDLALDVRLTGAALDCKIAALLAMHTQVAPAVALLGMDDFRALNAGEAFIEAP